MRYRIDETKRGRTYLKKMRVPFFIVRAAFEFDRELRPLEHDVHASIFLRHMQYVTVSQNFFENLRRRFHRGYFRPCGGAGAAQAHRSAGDEGHSRAAH